jgi:hypothetical protein
MAAFIEEEGLDEDGCPMKCRNLHHQQKHKCKQTKKVIQEDNEDNNKDSDFSDSSLGDGSSIELVSDMSNDRISNDKVSFSLLGNGTGNPRVI